MMNENKKPPLYRSIKATLLAVPLYFKSIKLSFLPDNGGWPQRISLSYKRENALSPLLKARFAFSR